MSEGMETPERVAERIYGKVPPHRLKMVATMIESHLEKLMDEGRVRAEEGRYFLVSSG